MTNQDPNQPASHRLPIVKTLIGAFWIPWHQRARFIRTLGIPIALQVFISLGWQYSTFALTVVSQWLLYTVYLLLYTMIAVRCHRLVLLDAGAENAFDLPKWSWRETRFLGYITGVWLLVLAVWFVAQLAIGIFMPRFLLESTGGELPAYISYSARILLFYVFARFSLAFPAIAIDAAGNLRDAWSRSQQNGWRLFVVVSVFPALVSLLLGMGFSRADNLWLDAGYNILANAFLVFEVVALSLAYRELA